MNYILHLSDFHLGKAPEIECERLESLSEWINKEKISVSYVIFTGDVIDARSITERCLLEFVRKNIGAFDNMMHEAHPEFDSDIRTATSLDSMQEQICTLFNSIKDHADLFSSRIVELGEDHIYAYNLLLKEYADAAMDQAVNLIQKFLQAIKVPYDQFITCCGNHDRLRYLSTSSSTFSCDVSHHINEVDFSDDFEPYERFCRAINNCLTYKTTVYSHNNINFFIANSNWRTPVANETNNMCIHCGELIKLLRNMVQSSPDSRNRNIFIAHKPFDDICENAKFPYGSSCDLTAKQIIEQNTSMFLHGDKHSYCIKAENWLKEFMCGTPLANDGVRYNLIQHDPDEGVKTSKFIVFSKDHWTQVPIISFMDEIYRISEFSLKKYAFRLLNPERNPPINWNGAVDLIQSAMDSERIPLIEQLFASSVKLYDNKKKLPIDRHNLLEQFALTVENSKHWLAMGLKGDPGRGKSTFLTIEYLYLLWRFYAGNCNYIPFYIDIDSLTDSIEKELYGQHQDKDIEAIIEAYLQKFSKFLEDSLKLSKKYTLPICLFVDGLDTQHMLMDTGLALEAKIHNLLEIRFKNQKHKCIMGLNTHSNQLFENSFEQFKQFQYALFFSDIHIVPYKKDARYPRFLEAYLSLTKGNNTVNFDTVLKKLRKTSIDLNFLDKFDELLCEDTSKMDSWLVMRKQVAKMGQIVQNLFSTKREELNRAAFLMKIKGYTYQMICEEYQLDNLRFSDFLKIRNNPDMAEFLVARHFIEELKKYTYSYEPIPEESILYCFITRDLAVNIRLQMEESGFQFRGLKIFAEHHTSNLHGHLSSTIVYLAGHSNTDGSAALIAKIPIHTEKESDFFKLCSKRSRALALIECEDKHQELANQYIYQLFNDEAFRSFHRSYQLHYYQDLTDLTKFNGDTWRIDKSNALGFDFNNCFLVLVSKLDYCFENNIPYPMLEIDLFTLCDLTYSRLQRHGEAKALFYSAENNQKGDSLAVAILQRIISLINQYNTIYKNKRGINLHIQAYFNFIEKKFMQVSAILEQHPGESQHSPFVPISQDIEEIIHLMNQPRVGWNIIEPNSVDNSKYPHYATPDATGMPKANWGNADPVIETIGQHILESMYIAQIYLPNTMHVDGYDKSTVITMLLMSELGKLCFKADYSPLYDVARAYLPLERECLNEFLSRGAIDGYADFSNLFDSFTIASSAQESQANINARITHEIKRIQMEYKFYKMYSNLKFTNIREMQFKEEFVEPQTSICKEIRKKVIHDNPQFSKYFSK